MRNCFASEITRLAAIDERIVLLSGDIGNRMFDDFKEVAPDRFINCGISEAAMMSIAAGLALEGFRPFVYTIAPFTTTRCLEQIKIGAAYHGLPVVIVGTGSGLSYAELGPTHYSFEDIAILRSIPDLNILAPCDKIELASHLNETLKVSSPSYIRIGKKGEPDLHRTKAVPTIGKSNILREGRDVLLLGIGPLLEEALTSAVHLESIGVSTAVVSMGSIKPLDKEFLRSAKARFKIWVTLEEHSVIGGLGSTVAEWLQQENSHEVILKILGIPDIFIHELGNQSYMREKLGLDSGGIIKSVLAMLEEHG